MFPTGFHPGERSVAPSQLSTNGTDGNRTRVFGVDSAASGHRTPVPWWLGAESNCRCQFFRLEPYH